VSIFNRAARFSYKQLLASIALIATANLAQAQTPTAPQLLPYLSKVIAGGGKTATFTVGQTCPVAGAPNVATDVYGDGCLATEIQLPASSTSNSGPRYAIADKTGAIFFSDGTNGLVRRVDPTTGIVTLIAGGASSTPAAGKSCGTNTSTDSDGDGCLSNLVKLSHPVGLAFDAAGNLYFADAGFDDVREVAATNGVVSGPGIITNVVGGTTFGYNVNNTAPGGQVIAATQSYLNFPSGIAFDVTGNLYIGDEGNNAIEVVNLTGASEKLQGLTIPAGTIAKIAGYGSLSAKTTTADCPDFVSTSARGGCYFGLWKDGSAAVSSLTNGPYGVAVDSIGNVYFANEFYDNVGQISAANILKNYAGIQNSAAKKLMRAAAGSFATGSPFGVATDAKNNLYVTDASNGVIWRVDASSQSMYVVAGGATSVCSGATDTFGDGCPATQAKFGSSGTGSFATTTLPGPGIFGITVDSNYDLFTGDTETNLIREVASGTQFGVIGANQPTNIVDIHFDVMDSPASSGAYQLTAGASNFSLGTATCTVNSDNTMDCLLPITATPSALGAFSGTLTITGQLGGSASYALNGTYAQSPSTRVSLAFSAPTVSCTGTTTYSVATPITLTATLIANGPSAPTGTITFFSNGTQVGTPQAVTNMGTASAPVYGATLTNTFSTANNYNFTATYNGDSYFQASTGKSASTLTTSTPTFSSAAVSNDQPIVVAGQTGIYSFNVTQSVYSGTITFGCSGLPANSSCQFSPTTLTASGCSQTSTVALSIITSQGAVMSAIGMGGQGIWAVLSMAIGLGLALLVGVRGQRLAIRYRQMWMVLALLIVASGMLACNSSQSTVASATPSGNYTVTVTSTGSSGTTSSFAVPLTVK